MEDAPLQNGEFTLLSVGDRLREARKAVDMSLEDVAGKTRVPIRHLEALEQSRFDDLPGRTYAIGFAKSYAGAVNLSPDDFVDDLRKELGAAGVSGMHNSETLLDEPEDPAKVPSARTAWIIAIVGIAVVIGGYALWRTAYFPGAADDSETTLADNAGDTANATAAASETPTSSAVVERQDDGTITAPATGDVVFTATEDKVWVKFYDGSGKQLLQKQMALGERYIVPADADNPQIWTGRPDAFSITIGGNAVPPLGTSERAIKDVPISAAALLARESETASTVGEDNGNGDDDG
ncbi:MAG: RodZ domain-containing protein [Pseudomonadota bacterium]